jgi:hypothetical protein
MADKEIWRRHVASWRASGQTAAEFSASHGLAVATLRGWSSKLKREAAGAAAPRVRLARVVRQPAAPASRRGEVVVEFLDLRARVIIEAGATRETLQVVLAALGVGGAR